METTMEGIGWLMQLFQRVYGNYYSGPFLHQQGRYGVTAYSPKLGSGCWLLGVGLKISGLRLSGCGVSLRVPQALFHLFSPYHPYPRTFNPETIP